MTGASTTTFLFTDLVGSTEILYGLGDDRAATLSRIHFDILRQALSAHGGQEVKSIGDSLMVTFTSASEAVSAAIAMQQAIDSYNRGGSGPRLQMRVGLHTGEPLWTGSDYVGLAVVIARRLCDIAEGEQIVASSIVRDLVGPRGRFAFLGLGDLSLKGVTEPVKAYAILWQREGEPAAAGGVLPAGAVDFEKVAPRRLRVLIVEDEPLWASLLSRSLSHEPSIEVVGSASNGETAVRLARELRPAAVLMDIQLKGAMDGIETALQIKEERPETGIVILSAHSDRRYITSLPLSEKPGWSYLLKQSAPDISTVVRAVQASVEGMLMLDPAIVAGLRPRPASPLMGLTPRQLEALRLMAAGYDDSAIAERLALSPAAAESEVGEIFRQLGLADEAPAMARVKASQLFLDQTLAAG